MGRHDEDREWDLVAIARDVAEKEGFIIGFPKDARRSEPKDDDSVVDERHLLWSSVDNRESTDLDQVEVAERLADDVIRVKVGIADVDAFVPRGSALDKHAVRIRPRSTRASRRSTCSPTISRAATPRSFLIKSASSSSPRWTSRRTAPSNASASIARA